MENVCKNCSAVYKGNYCPICSQSAHTKRIDAHYLLHDIPHSVFHVDKGLPYTFLNLAKQPGKTLLDYIKGRRVKYFKPFAYVLVLSTISSLFFKFFGKSSSSINSSGFLLFLTHYPSILIFCLIPIVSLISWLVFIKKEFNYWEHFTAHTYLAAQINIIFILLHGITYFSFFNNANMMVKLMVFNFIYMSYHGFAFSSLFTNNYKEKFTPKLLAHISFCCFLLATFYAMALGYSGLASKWF
jgi:hypothetical protein